MDGSLRLAFGLLLLFIVGVPVRGQQIIQEQLLGDWVFNYEVSLELMNEPARLHYEQMDADEQANLEQAYQNRRLVFGPESFFAGALYW